MNERIPWKYAETSPEVFLVSNTFDTVTPESAEQGDVADSGFEWMDRRYTLRDLLRDIEADCYTQPDWWRASSVSFYNDSQDINYRSGEATTYALHIKAAPRHLARLKKMYFARILKRGSKPCE